MARAASLGGTLASETGSLSQRIRGLTALSGHYKPDEGEPGQDLIAFGEFVLSYPPQFRLPGAAIDPVRLSKQWVTTTEGEYFFSPSISALSRNDDLAPSCLPRGQLDRSPVGHGGEELEPPGTEKVESSAAPNMTTDSVACRTLTAVPPPVQSTGTSSISDGSVIVISRSSSFASLSPRWR
jgi:hypothetical protein